MTFDQLELILKEAKKIHKSLVPRIDFATENKAHAIYPLQGGSITATTMALEFNSKGYIMPTTMLKRLIDETLDLVSFFDEHDENERQLKAWFKGHVVEREPGNKGNLSTTQRANYYGKSEIWVTELTEIQKKINGIMSKRMHPTLDVMRANSSKSSHKYDYSYNKTLKPFLLWEDFGTFYLVPCLQTLLIAPRFLKLSEAQFLLLREYVKQLSGS